jgi:hypothetical protein
MTKNTKNTKPKSATPKKPMPSYLKEAFNIVQTGKSNHFSPKNTLGGQRSRKR